MKTSFWVKRYCLVLVSAFAVLFSVYALRGGNPAAAAREAVLWATISATIFLVSALYRFRRAHACRLCADVSHSAKAASRDGGV